MSGPTLLVPGSLRAPADADEKTPPIDYIVTWLKKRMPEFGGLGAELADRVLIVRSETGSGKSTVLPTQVFRILRSEKTSAKSRYAGPSVLCTQPRVLTAVALATQTRASPHYPDLAGVTGFQTGPLSDKPPSGLIFATIGVLAAQLKLLSDDTVMSLYRFIIVDEAHERSKEADMTLLRLKNFYKRNLGNRRLPFLILASATFDVRRYAKFFGVDPETNCVEVVGRQFPITDHFPPTGVNDYIAAAARKAIEIHETSKDPEGQRDILIFVPGNLEIEGVAKILEAEAKKPAGPAGRYVVLAINREAILDETPQYRQVFGELPLVGGEKPTRRIIISTVVAETGLTVETLKHVIDCGWSRTVEVYQPFGISGLTTRPAPQSRIRQRKGRVGRLFAGDFYPLYSQNVHNSLDPQQLPDIITGGVSDIFLDIVSEQLRAKTEQKGFRVDEIDLLDTPPPDALAAALEKALALGFVAEQLDGAFALSPTGAVAAKFSRTPPEGVRIILAGLVHGASLRDLATVVAAFGRPLQSFLEMPSAPKAAALLKDICPEPHAKLALADEFIETLLLFEAFSAKLAGSLVVATLWCAEFEISMDALLEFVEAREQIIEEMLAAGLDLFANDDKRVIKNFSQVSVIKRCIYDGLRLNTLTYDEKRDKYKTRHGHLVEVAPLLGDKEARALGMKSGLRPKYIVAGAVILSPVKTEELLYTIKAKMVSVLDGFVPVDLELTEFPGCDSHPVMPGNGTNGTSAAEKIAAYQFACGVADTSRSPLSLVKVAT